MRPCKVMLPSPSTPSLLVLLPISGMSPKSSQGPPSPSPARLVVPPLLLTSRPVLSVWSPDSLWNVSSVPDSAL